MGLAEDLEEQIIELELKRDCYVRLAETAECSQLHARYLQTIEDISARIDELFRALAATPERRADPPKSEGPLQEVELTTDASDPEAVDAFDEEPTRVWRRPGAPQRARALRFTPPFVTMR